MSGLPWVRLDTNIWHHDKVFDLLAERDGYRAFTVYVCSLAYSGGTGTDGLITKRAVPTIYGTKRTTDLLVLHGLWIGDPAGKGWRVKNWDTRQELAVVAESKRAAKQAAANKANCIRHHGPDCNCWKAAA